MKVTVSTGVGGGVSKAIYDAVDIVSFIAPDNLPTPIVQPDETRERGRVLFVFQQANILAVMIECDDADPS